MIGSFKIKNQGGVIVHTEFPSICVFCKRKLIPFEKICVSLLAPNHEFIVGGRNPEKVINIDLPLVYCENCGLVYSKKIIKPY